MGLFRKKSRRGHRSFMDRLFRGVVLKRWGRGLLYDLQIQAKNESLAYIDEHMRGIPFFEDPDDILYHALGQVTKTGLFLEFGVASGKSIRKIAKRAPDKVHGFDSFEGLPEAWGSNPIGKFDQKGQLPEAPSNVELHAGWFNETLPPFLAANTSDIAFLHIDCDLYSSTKTVFETCRDRIQPGTVILFDEYFNYPHWTEHEHKAFVEFVQETGITYEYTAFSCMRTQVAATILTNPAHAGR